MADKIWLQIFGPSMSSQVWHHKLNSNVMYYESCTSSPSDPVWSLPGLRWCHLLQTFLQSPSSSAQIARHHSLYITWMAVEVGRNGKGSKRSLIPERCYFACIIYYNVTMLNTFILFIVTWKNYLRNLAVDNPVFPFLWSNDIMFTKNLAIFQNSLDTSSWPFFFQPKLWL